MCDDDCGDECDEVCDEVGDAECDEVCDAEFDGVYYFELDLLLNVLLNVLLNCSFGFLTYTTYVEGVMNEEFNSPVKPWLRKETWLRLLLVLLFIACIGVAQAVLAASVAVQFGFLLIGGSRNLSLLEFGEQLRGYIDRVLCYITFESDDKPFPFAKWSDD